MSQGEQILLARSIFKYIKTGLCNDSRCVRRLKIVSLIVMLLSFLVVLCYTSEVTVPGGVTNESQVARLLTSSKALG
jgi:hypothetical protein